MKNGILGWDKLYVLWWLATFAIYWYAQASLHLYIVITLGDAMSDLGVERIHLVRWLELVATAATAVTSFALGLLAAFALPRRRSADLVVVIVCLTWLGGAIAASSGESFRGLSSMLLINTVGTLAALLGCGARRKFFG